MKKFPKFSVIIPAKQDSDLSQALLHLKKISYPQKLIEVFISYGSSPSRQRNLAAKQAKGEILYFLDNDSRIDKKAFKKVVEVFFGQINAVNKHSSRGFSLIPDFITDLIIKKLFSGTIYKRGIGAVGGPAVWDGGEGYWSQLARGILESFFAHFLMAARYRPIGPIHRASEKELILCNLAIRRDVFNKVKGFSEFLYPNEENELLNRIDKRGYQLVYHPGVLVRRPHRESAYEILKMTYHYGRGRAEQVRTEGIVNNIIFLTPLLLILYLMVFIFYHPFWLSLPLLAYLGMSLVSTIGFARRNKKILLIFLSAFFFLAHLSYSLGLIMGSLTSFEKKKKKNNKTKVRIVRVKKFNSGWRV